MELFKKRENTIGIPRALVYYNHFPFWYGFLTKLGIKVVLSDPTTKKTLSDGSSLVVSETCLPIKIYIGHVVNLVEKGVKRIFVPSIQSIAPKIYNCSKIRGLPDLVKNVVKGNYTIVDATLDKSAKNHGLYDFLYQIARKYRIRDKELIKEASKAGWIVYNNFHTMVQNGLNYDAALKNAMEGNVIIPPRKQENFINIAVVSHAYNIYDKKACMDVFKKLQNLGVTTYNAFELTDAQLKEGVKNLGDEIYWANELEMTGCAGHYLANGKIDGIITITAFGCGPDSLMIERIIRKSKDFKKPILNLTIDEHTGEAGFITRIEAFCDMLSRKKRAEKALEKTNA